MINKEKCVFVVEEVYFLCHHVYATRVAPIASRVAAIFEHPQPTTAKELQGFLDVLNFYIAFVLPTARILKPLMDRLKGSPKPSSGPLRRRRPFWQPRQPWREVSGSSTLLLEQRSLCWWMPQPSTSGQRSNSGHIWRRPLGFFSRKLDAKGKYSDVDRELLACVLGFRHFRHMLEGPSVHNVQYTVRHTGLQEFPNLNRCSKAGTYNGRVNYSRADKFTRPTEYPRKPWRMIDANRVLHFFKSKCTQRGSYLRRS